jgi:hypothetical protein
MRVLHVMSRTDEGAERKQYLPTTAERSAGHSFCQVMQTRQTRNIVHETIDEFCVISQGRNGECSKNWEVRKHVSHSLGP